MGATCIGVGQTGIGHMYWWKNGVDCSVVCGNTHHGTAMLKGQQSNVICLSPSFYHAVARPMRATHRVWGGGTRVSGCRRHWLYNVDARPLPARAHLAVNDSDGCTMACLGPLSIDGGAHGRTPPPSIPGWNCIRTWNYTKPLTTKSFSMPPVAH